MAEETNEKKTWVFSNKKSFSIVTIALLVVSVLKLRAFKGKSSLNPLMLPF
jgi:hypothetical protein